jgi:hypothetical protein
VGAQVRKIDARHFQTSRCSGGEVMRLSFSASSSFSSIMSWPNRFGSLSSWICLHKQFIRSRSSRVMAIALPDEEFGRAKWRISSTGTHLPRFHKPASFTHQPVSRCNCSAKIQPQQKRSNFKALRLCDLSACSKMRVVKFAGQRALLGQNRSAASQGFHVFRRSAYGASILPPPLYARPRR